MKIFFSEYVEWSSKSFKKSLMTSADVRANIKQHITDYRYLVSRLPCSHFRSSPHLGSSFCCLFLLKIIYSCNQICKLWKWKYRQYSSTEGNLIKNLTAFVEKESCFFNKICHKKKLKIGHWIWYNVYSYQISMVQVLGQLSPG